MTPMRTFFASAAVVASLALVPVVASAASLAMTGTVKSYSATQKVIKLSNGESFIVPASFKDPGLKAGEKVKITYKKAGSKMEADTVTIVH
jgi:P pilus assembly chaperone PapD